MTMGEKFLSIMRCEMHGKTAIGVEDHHAGHRLPVWIVRAGLGALVGCAMAARPCYWMAWPLVLRPIWGLTAACAASSWLVCIYGSILMGWTPEHLAGGLAYPVSLVMLGLSCAGAWLARSEADCWLVLTVVLCLPGLWASNAAYHLILAVPFGVACCAAYSRRCHRG